MTIFATATFGGSNGTELAVADAAFAKAIACDNAVLHNGRVIAAAARVYPEPRVFPAGVLYPFHCVPPLKGSP